jgi:uncharacterized ferritin-like protein (DUF455 family)
MRSSDSHFANQYAPFRPTSARADGVRALAALGGVEDRLRLVAFAELQARDLFRYGAERFAAEAPADWIADWLRFAEVEDRHAQMLLTRMLELGLDPGARTVSDKLTRLCYAAGDATMFLFILSGAEQRGMEAGQILGEQMRTIDPASAAIFAQIAGEELEHVHSAHAALAPFMGAALRNRARDLSATL